MSTCEDERLAWFREQILPLGPELRLRALRYCRTGEAADDLVHDTFLRLITYQGGRGVTHPRAFALGVMRNLMMDALRRAQVVAFDAIADVDELGATDDLPGPEAVLIGRDELQRLRTAIAELPLQCRRAFTLRKVYDLPMAAIADRLGISVSMVEKHVAKGLRLCAERLMRETPAATPAVTGRAWRDRRTTAGRR
jgi:RNA polymerase sigma factor (sigma-70 family)